MPFCELQHAEPVSTLLISVTTFSLKDNSFHADNIDPLIPTCPVLPGLPQFPFTLASPLTAIVINTKPVAPLPLLQILSKLASMNSNCSPTLGTPNGSSQCRAAASVSQFPGMNRRRILHRPRAGQSSASSVPNKHHKPVPQAGQGKSCEVRGSKLFPAFHGI